MQIITTTASFTRPNDTTAYASGDLMANSTTAGSVVPVSFSIPRCRAAKLYRIGIQKTNTTNTNFVVRLHLYTDSPTVTNGDNAAWVSTVSGYQGYMAPDAALTFSSGAKIWGPQTSDANTYPPLFIAPDRNGALYGLLEARGAYTPTANEVYTITLIGEAYA
jgi:hypothetical protein